MYFHKLKIPCCGGTNKPEARLQHWMLSEKLNSECALDKFQHVLISRYHT